MSSLEDLKSRMENCDACSSLCEHRSRVVFGSGQEVSPKIFIIGEAPGEAEDMGGVPFNAEGGGRSGIQLDKILRWVGVGRDECYISNAILCRPPNNRNPLWDEIKACRWRLMLQIKLLDPDIIVCLGKFAAASIMGREFKGPLKQFFDNELLEFQLDGKTYKWLCTYHPSYLLRRPGEKRTVVPHWNLVKQWVAQKRR